MAYRPKLRAHLHLEEGRLADWLLQRTISLDGAAAALAPRLDGEHDWDELRAGLAADGHDEDDLDQAMRGFLFMHATEGAGDALAARLERVVGKQEQVPTSLLAGARFECQGSGGCCQGYMFGPLSDDDVARLDRLDLAGAFPHLQPPYYHEEPDRGRFLARDGDRCVFLEGSNRCGIHARFGADAKPALCRMYPLDSFATVEGIRIVDRGNCATFGVSARRGLPLVDDLDRVRPLMDPPLLHHPPAVVDGWAWDYGLFLRFTTAACDLVRANVGTASATFGAIARMLGALADGVLACPLAPGEPDATVSAVLATPHADWYGDPDPVESTIALRRLVSLLHQLAPAMHEAADRGKAKAATERFRALTELVERADSVLVAHDGTVVAPDYGPDVDDALRISLRQQLFGRHVLLGSHAGSGLVRIGLLHLIALVGARVDAGARPITAADLSRGHMLANRVLNTNALDALFVEHEPRWRLVCEGIAVAAGAVLQVPAE
jgi:Fe-S-cluster containining protein